MMATLPKAHANISLNVMRPLLSWCKRSAYPKRPCDYKISVPLGAKRRLLDRQTNVATWEHLSHIQMQRVHSWWNEAHRFWILGALQTWELCLDSIKAFILLQNSFSGDCGSQYMFDEEVIDITRKFINLR
jgi:hypothetical protein